MAGVNGRYGTEHTPGFWLGRLSMALAVAPRHPDVARDVLKEFVRSPVPTGELKGMLKEEMKR